MSSITFRIYFQAYCYYLNVSADSFRGMRVVDIGCGPHGALSLFHADLRIGVEPLSNRYNQHFELSKQEMVYLNAFSENIPLVDHFADVVISRNALDHVDDFGKSIGEIHRILKKGGRIIFGLNYQNHPTVCEPQVLNDEVVDRALQAHFSYKIVRRIPANQVWTCAGETFSYAHEIVVIEGTKK